MTPRTLFSLAFLLAAAAIALLFAGRHVEAPPPARERSTAARIIHRIHATTGEGWNRSMAFEEAAKEREARGDWVTALRLWQAWEPYDLCGVGTTTLRMKKHDWIIECLIRLRDYDAAARYFWAAHVGDHPNPGHRPADLIVQLYRAAGQARDLDGLLDQMDRAYRRRIPAGYEVPNVSREEMLRGSPMGPVLEALHARELAQRRDVAGLIALFKGEDRDRGFALAPDLPARTIAEALAECGEAAVEPVAAAAKATGGRAGLVLALGLMRSPAALKALVELPRTAHPWDVAFALALHGDAGRSVLRRWADGAAGPELQDAARRQLDRPLAPGWRPLKLHPAPNSLPTRLPVVTPQR